MNTQQSQFEGKYWNSPPSGPESNDQTPVNAHEGLEVEAKIALDEVGKTVAGPPPKVEPGKQDVLIRASGEKGKKRPMLKAEGERFDAGVKEHCAKVGSLLAVVSSLWAKVDGAVKRLDFELRHIEKEKEVQRRVLRYTWGSIGLIIASLLLLGVGTNTIATILIGSGLKGFENPVRAYFFSFIPAGLTLALVGIYSLTSDVRGVIFVRWIWAAGLVCGAVWVMLLAQVCSGFLQTADVILKAVLSAGANPSVTDPGINSPLMLGCGILAEIFLSAGCSIGSRRACTVVHEGVKRPNEDYRRLATEVAKLSQLRAALDIAKAKLKARLEQLAANRKDFLNSAEALFDLSVAGQLKSASNAAKFTAMLLVAASCVVEARAATLPENSCRLIIGVTDHSNPAEREFTEAAVDGILLTNGWNGPVEVFDAGRCEKIGSFFVTNDARSPVAKLRQNARFVSALHTFLYRDTNNCDGHILIPQFTEFVGTHLHQVGEHAVLWLIGSERYRSKELGYNMATNLVPSIDHVFASEKTSVFGTLEKSNLLAGVAVHLIYREEDFLSKFHADAVADFWNVFLTQQGAKVISNSSEFETVLDRILRGISEPYKVVTPAPIGRVTMLAVIGDKLIPVENTTPDAPAVDTAKLKQQIEDKDRQLKLAESQAATATALKAQLGSATSKVADLANAAAQADAQSAKLTAELAAVDHRQVQAAAQARHDALIAAGDSIESLTSKVVPYEQALAVAVSNQIDPATALGRLQSVRSKLAPVLLPTGVTAELTRISVDDYPPCLALDLAIEDSVGQPVLGLADKDFTVVFGGQRAAVRTAYVPKLAESQMPLNLLIALDCSGSMDRVLPQAKAAVSSMLAAFRNRSNFQAKVLSFNGSVKVRCDWTPSIDTAAQAVSGLTASGSTALYKAIAEGVSSLAEQPGDRRLVVFTDGGDNKGGPYSPTSLGVAMKTDGILSYFIGLKTADLDKKDLNKMAALSGGYFSMADAEDLSAVFGDAAKRLGRQTYRLIILPKDLPSSQSPLLGLMVGGGQTMVTVKTNISVPVITGPTAFNK